MHALCDTLEQDREPCDEGAKKPIAKDALQDPSSRPCLSNHFLCKHRPEDSPTFKVEY
jgi:hypothetical protein